jgi:5-formyltetrahydrofolate cyclo-ligase
MRPLPTKADIRRNILSRRDLIAPPEAHAAALEIAGSGLALAARHVASGGVVSAYWPIRSEMSPRPLIEALARAGFRTALPTMPGAGKPLHFRRWSPGDDLEKGPLGLSEPVHDAPEVEPDFVFAPLVAFDSKGRRIGYGGGNFDATLAFLRARKRIVAAGLAFASQEIDIVPAEPHDQRLDFVVTEEKVFSFGVLR